MLPRKRLLILYSIVVACLSINLLFPMGVRAQLSISGLSQMSTGTSQTLTVSGGSGGYSWEIVSGGGNITASDETAIYNAPDTNPHCNNNPQICVRDSSGWRTCKKISVNGLPGLYIAGKTGLETCTASCIDNFYAETCRCDAYYCDGSPTFHSNCACGSSCASHCHASNCPLCFTVDLRDDAMIQAGCCPEQAPDGGGLGSNTTGPDCGSNVPANSSANIMSGNLYFTESLAGLTLSYNSSEILGNGLLGYGWTFEYDQSLLATFDSSIRILKKADGNRIVFRLSNGVFYPEKISGNTSSIVKNPRNVNNAYTMTTKDGTVYNFHAAGRLSSIIDKNGKTTTLNYENYGGYLSSVIDSNGRVTTFTVSAGRITGITDTLGRTYKLTYIQVPASPRYFLATITDPLGNIYKYTYNSSKKMVSKTSPLDNTTTYTYDRSGKLLASTDPEGKTRTMTYVSNGFTTLTDKDGGEWTYFYDPIFGENMGTPLNY